MVRKKPAGHPRLPASVKATVMRREKTDCTRFNEFVGTAVSEKLAAMNTAAFFLGIANARIALPSTKS